MQAAFKTTDRSVIIGPIEPLQGLKPLARAGSLGQDMAGRDTRGNPGSAGLSAAFS
jgi:hypothetical protein